MTPSKEELARTLMVWGRQSKLAYFCKLCDVSLFDADDCINHIMNTHDEELEMRMVT